jgi:hypothetical protein
MENEFWPSWSHSRRTSGPGAALPPHSLGGRREWDGTPPARTSVQDYHKRPVDLNGSTHSPLARMDGYVVNMAVSVFDIAVLCITAAVCVELPGPFPHNRPRTRQKAPRSQLPYSSDGDMVIRDSDAIIRRVTDQRVHRAVCLNGRRTKFGALASPYLRRS